MKPSQSEYTNVRVPSDKLLGGSHFAATYAAEHVAGGEFVIGAAFAAWGASPMAVLVGLVMGNLLAVLSWAWVCAPVAVRARLTLYEYLSRTAGVGFVRVFNVVNGLIFLVIAGGMMTISAQAIQGIIGQPPQMNWYPSSMLFVILVGFVGLMVVLISLMGFRQLTNFARYVSPYLFVIFVVCALASLPILWQSGKQSGLSFGEIFSTYLWTPSSDNRSLSMWHIAVFTWGLNLPLHLGLGDMSTLRFAKKWRYGYHSVWACYGGHFVAWVGAGMLGAGSAILLGVSVHELDIGGVVVPILGLAGVLAVVLASVTTAVPSLYRAALAFDALWHLGFTKTVLLLGVLTTAVACLPLIFLKWLDLMAYFNIVMAPVGAIIACEHFILPRLGVRPFWYGGKSANISAIKTWLFGLLLAVILLMSGVHLFFVFIPVWFLCVAFYALMAYPRAQKQTVHYSLLYDVAYGADQDICVPQRHHQQPKSAFGRFIVLLAMLMMCLPLYVSDPVSMLGVFQLGLFVLSVLYFVIVGHQMKHENNNNA
ncbi:MULTISPECIES: hypothetical protein [unclassified Moraxella]|uniref:hypothetical protein n=1 Tax=unclassified Moraxella TaxID=2685852 RepID=UPI00359DBE90